MPLSDDQLRRLQEANTRREEARAKTTEIARQSFSHFLANGKTEGISDKGADAITGLVSSPNDQR